MIERATIDNRSHTNFDLRLQTRTGKLWCNLSSLIASDSVSGVRHAIYIVQAGAPAISALPATSLNVRLTSREVEVLKSLAKGHSTRRIANQLNISSATVNNHVKHILAKFDVHTRLEAIRHAERRGRGFAQKVTQPAKQA